MVELEVGGWAILIFGALLAGWVDAVIGGGGLVLIPLLLAVAPGLAPASALATNKLAAVFGTASAAFTLMRRIRPSRALLLGYIPLAVVCAGGGALAASLIQASVMRPVIIVLMLAVGIFVAFRPSFGGGESGELPARGWRRWVALGGVGLVAAYDGVFGPGTGMFLIMLFTSVLSQNFLSSAAMAKVVNTATNFGALLIFALNGHVWWTLGLVLAVANIAGAQMGAKTVLGGGIRFIRVALLTMVVVMGVYLSYQQFSLG
ncbi:hypothetical protein COCCU_00880 [Corynebacterium occultum]|uniref:Probable membrane transporter protein n=1 Tax=Corynebacterium occultum TaxID=2675219 RepID=A0A6B8VXS9_9CORY|nr:hypothetical protein COCCU_00880 [Corynebacterium occultum]